MRLQYLCLSKPEEQGTSSYYLAQQYQLKGTTSASQAIAIGRTVNPIASILAGIDLDRVHIYTAEKAH